MPTNFKSNTRKSAIHRRRNRAVVSDEAQLMLELVISDLPQSSQKPRRSRVKEFSAPSSLGDGLTTHDREVTAEVSVALPEAMKVQRPKALGTTSSVPDRILRMPAVQAATGLGRTTIYLRIRKGTFPAPLPLGDHAVGWQSSAIAAWIEGRSQLEKRSGAAARFKTNRS